jgi:hypothetical protein
MTQKRHFNVAAVCLLLGMSMAGPAVAQEPGGILRQYIIDSPASMSIHEETTVVGSLSSISRGMPH